MVTISLRVRHRPCFALIDCIVATVLLGIALAVMIGLASNALSSQTTGEKLATAATLADEQLQLVLARGPDDYTHRFPVQGQCDAPFNDYSYKLVFAKSSRSFGTPTALRSITRSPRSSRRGKLLMLAPCGKQPNTH